jgi:hypothetical protein
MDLHKVLRGGAADSEAGTVPPGFQRLIQHCAETWSENEFLNPGFSNSRYLLGVAMQQWEG